MLDPCTIFLTTTEVYYFIAGIVIGTGLGMILTFIVYETCIAPTSNDED